MLEFFLDLTGDATVLSVKIMLNPVGQNYVDSCRSKVCWILSVKIALNPVGQDDVESYRLKWCWTLSAKITLSPVDQNSNESCQLNHVGQHFVDFCRSTVFWVLADQIMLHSVGRDVVESCPPGLLCISSVNILLNPVCQYHEEECCWTWASSPSSPCSPWTLRNRFIPPSEQNWRFSGCCQAGTLWDYILRPVLRHLPRRPSETEKEIRTG